MALSRGSRGVALSEGIRLYEQDQEVFAAVDHDLTLAAAYPIGRDAAQIARDETAQHEQQLLRSLRQMDRLLNQIIVSTTFPERTQTVENVLQQFR